MRKQTLTAILAFSSMILSAVTSFADDRTPSCVCGIPTATPASWSIQDASSQFHQPALDSFRLWNRYVDVLRPSISASGTIALGLLGASGGVNEVAFYDFDSLPSEFGDLSKFAGLTLHNDLTAFSGAPRFNQCPRPAGTACGGTWSEADIILNAAIPWSSQTPEVGVPASAQYYQGTLVHEIGHSMGMHHNFRNVSIMNYYPQYAGQFITRTDILALRQQFPNRVVNVTDLATYPFSYDAALQPVNLEKPNTGDDATTAANFSPASVQPGGKITIRNWTIENLSTAPVADVRLRFFLSTDRNITTDDIYIGGIRYDSFSTWDDDPVGREFTIPSNVPAGSYYVGAIVLNNSTGSPVQDGLTYNNSWSLPTRLQVGSSSSGAQGNPLRLVNGRFELTLTGKDTGRTNATGVGVPIQEPGNDKFGFFYFNIPGAGLNNPNNPEVFVKVLGPLPGDHYWVFYSGLTDLEYALTVNDRQTGKSRTYNKPAGSLCGQADTGTFAIPGVDGNSAKLNVFTFDVDDGTPSARAIALTGAADAPVHTTSSCGVELLCLLNDRFIMALAAQTPDGSKSGLGQPIKKSDGFGYFSIPSITQDPNNPEAFVKLLNAGGSTYFIFLGALTDFELALAVKDTVTGKVVNLSRPKSTLCGKAALENF